MAIKIRHSELTDVGKVRNHNEDNLLVLPNLNLYMVADGMGGHAHGEVASQMAVETLADFFAETCEDEEITWPYNLERDFRFEENRLRAGIKLANRLIFERGESDSAQSGRMGTTIVAISFDEHTAYLGHVGDSRIYRFRNKHLEQITEDHSLLSEYKKVKNLTEEEIEKFPHKNVIVRALGMSKTVEVDVANHVPEPGDLYLLCSDGLSGMLSDNQMAEIINSNREDLNACVQELINAANDHGGKDNITAVLVEIING